MTLISNRSTNNNNREDYKERLNLIFVEMAADELCKRFNNPGYKKWYCKVIHSLGLERTEILAERVRDSSYAGKLFSRLANEEMRIKNKNKRFDDIKKR
jgi:hypothetical protein